MNPKKIDPSYTFSLSMEDFDTRGEKYSFNGKIFDRGPKGKTEKYF